MPHPMPESTTHAAHFLFGQSFSNAMNTCGSQVFQLSNTDSKVETPKSWVTLDLSNQTVYAHPVALTSNAPMRCTEWTAEQKLVEGKSTTDNMFEMSATISMKTKGLSIQALQDFCLKQKR